MSRLFTRFRAKLTAWFLCSDKWTCMPYNAPDFQPHGIHSYLRNMK
jgi:hypothetical protein